MLHNALIIYFSHSYDDGKFASQQKRISVWNILFVNNTTAYVLFYILKSKMHTRAHKCVFKHVNICFVSNYFNRIFSILTTSKAVPQLWPGHNVAIKKQADTVVGTFCVVAGWWSTHYISTSGLHTDDGDQNEDQSCQKHHSSQQTDQHFSAAQLTY